MSLYSNINAYEQISSFFPRWYLDIYEMKEIIKIEALVATNMEQAIDLILDNHFIDTLNEEKASELEAYLNISSVSDRSIEERRAIIKTYFLGRGKLSLSQIIAIVQALSGGKVTGSFLPRDSVSNNYIRIQINNCDIKTMLVDIISALQERIPAHLWVELYYTPRKIDIPLIYKNATRDSFHNVIGSPGIRNEKSAKTDCYIACASRQSLCTYEMFTTSILYGGNSMSNYSNIVCGGNLSDDLENVINGNY